jgi:hypothetical protein
MKEVGFLGYDLCSGPVALGILSNLLGPQVPSSVKWPGLHMCNVLQLSTPEILTRQIISLRPHLWNSLVFGFGSDFFGEEHIVKLTGLSGKCLVLSTSTLCYKLLSCLATARYSRLPGGAKQWDRKELSLGRWIYERSLQELSSQIT